MSTLIHTLGWTALLLAGFVALTELVALLFPPKADYDCRQADGYIADNSLWSDEYFREWRKVQFQFKWEPFSYWRSRHHCGKYVNIDENGRRQTWNPPLEPTGSLFQICLFGGSTLWGAGVRDVGTIPSLLSRMLATEGVTTQVANLGQIGYVSTQEVISLIRLLQSGTTPDLVIFYDGYNDVLSALMNGSAGLAYREDHRAHEFLILKRPTDLALSALRSLAINRLFTRKENHLRQPVEPERVVKLASEIASVELSNFLVAKSLGQEFGFDVQFFWQPNIFQKNSLSEYELSQRQVIEFSRDVFLVVTRLLAEARDRIASSGLIILDDVFEDIREPCFIDWAHLTESANEIIARRILSVITPILITRNRANFPAKSTAPQN